MRRALQLYNRAVEQQWTDPLLTQREVCGILRISPKTLQVWRQRGLIRFRNFGYRTIRIRRSDVLRFIERGASL